MEAGPSVAGIGSFADGSVLGYDMQTGGSFMFVGAAGSGKTVALHTLVGGVLARGGHVVVGKPRIRLGDYERYLGEQDFELAQGSKAITASLVVLAASKIESRTLVVIDDTPMLVDQSKADPLVYTKKRLLAVLRSLMKNPMVDVVLASNRLDQNLLGAGWQQHLAPVQFGRMNQAASQLAFGEVADTSRVSQGQVVTRHEDGTLQVADIWMRDLP